MIVFVSFLEGLIIVFILKVVLLSLIGFLKYIIFFFVFVVLYLFVDEVSYIFLYFCLVC